MASPIKLSHVVLQTNQPRELREWYCKVLGTKIVHENDFTPGALPRDEPGDRDSGEAWAGGNSREY
jgi:hypothetical protein